MTFGRRPPRSRRQGPEAIEQQNIVRTVAQLGGKCYVLGTKRGLVKCVTCGSLTPEHQGTKQTPGVSDVLAFIPYRAGEFSAVLVFVEAKAPGRARTKNAGLSPDQVEFRDWCQRACQEHLVGGFNVFANWLIERGIVKETAFAHYRVSVERG